MNATAPVTATDLRDHLIQLHAPTVMIDNHQPLYPLAGYGHRYLAARNGLWLDIHRPIGRIRAPLAPLPPGVTLPYGGVEPIFDFAFGRLSAHAELLQQFVADARESLPLEFAAWLVWDSYDGQIRYRRCRTLSATAGSVHFERPALDNSECLAVDLHSHGSGPAFFSATDNIDDRGDVKIAGVFGNLDTDRPSAVFRVCALGVFIDVPVPAGIWK